MVGLLVAVEEFPRGMLVSVSLLAVAAGVALALLRRGAWRVVGIVLTAAGIVGVVQLILSEGRGFETVLMFSLAGGAVVLARLAFLVRADLPRVPSPERPVLIYNPLSGDGKAAAVDLARHARERGIEPIELTRGDDLRALAEDAVARGADALAMAGGDGSQAIVADVAAAHGLPYACVPAGTRNHFALDLGVDRTDVVGGLDAFVDGGERIVDLAEVNGRVFVNNVSLGLYAVAVQRTGYREAKVRTLLDVLPDALTPDADATALRWRGPDDTAHRSAAAMLVSNDPYRLGGPIGSGTRPRLDAGVLGVLVAVPRSAGGVQALRTEWETPTLQVDADEPVAAGIDGEAAALEPPLVFRSRPGALRVRIARAHPGASPSAAVPKRFTEGLRALVRIAAGHEPTNERSAHDGHVRG